MDSERDILSFIIGHRIRSLRQAKGISQGKLGLGLGSQSLISLIESGRQFPAKDVLYEIGKRLADEELQMYADSLEASDISLYEMILKNNDLLFEALCDYHNTWTDIQLDAALNLCEFYYTSKNYERVKTLTDAIMGHVRPGVAYAKACFYRGSTLLAQYNYEEAGHWLKETEKYMDKNDTRLRARLFYNLSFLHTQMDIQVMALWYGKLAMDEFSHLQDIHLSMKATALVGVIERRMGRLQDALQSLQRAHDALSRLVKDIESQARVESSLAEVNLLLGYYPKAEYWCLQAIESGEKVNDTASIFSGFKTLCITKWKQGEFEQGQDALTKAMELAQALNDVVSAAEIFLIGTWLKADLPDKLKSARQALEVLESTNNHAFKGFAAERLAQIYEELGEHEKAGELWVTVREAYRAHVMSSSQVSSLIQNFTDFCEKD
jgi:transcriptional regulator with XRE-family HTH domain